MARKRKSLVVGRRRFVCDQRGLRRTNSWDLLKHTREYHGTDEMKPVRLRQMQRCLLCSVWLAAEMLQSCLNSPVTDLKPSLTLLNTSLGGVPLSIFLVNPLLSAADGRQEEGDYDLNFIFIFYVNFSFVLRCWRPLATGRSRNLTCADTSTKTGQTARSETKSKR